MIRSGRRLDIILILLLLPNHTTSHGTHLKYPASASAPSIGRPVRLPTPRKTSPTTMGIPVAKSPGATISCSASFVTMATHAR